MNGWIRAAAILILWGALSAPLVAEESKPDAMRGAKLFGDICAHCHLTSYEESKVAAPGLKGVLERHDVKWLNQWIKSPEAFAKKDETAGALLGSNKYGLKMPTLPEMQDDKNRADVIEYLKTLKGD